MQQFDSKNSGTKSPRHTTSIFCVDIRWKAFGATKIATPFVASVKNTQPSILGEKLFHRSSAALLPLTCKFPDRRNSLAPVLQVTVFWLNHSQALAVVWSYASPPSSPGGNAYECHSSSSAWVSQNHLPHLVQRTVAGRWHGSLLDDMARQKRSESALHSCSPIRLLFVTSARRRGNQPEYGTRTLRRSADCRNCSQVLCCP